LAKAKKEKKQSPLMKQYYGIKAKYPEAILLFRVGDFYETFAEDAIEVAQILGIVLTKRGAGTANETALAGFPHHSLNTYLPKLVKAGLRVAICDQLEDPKLTKTIVKRGVTELITPGVSLNDEVLHAKTNNFLAAIHFEKHTIGVAFLDVSTGEFLVSEGNADYIDKLLQNFNPKEVLYSKQKKQDFKTHFGEDFYAFYLEDWIFQTDYTQEKLRNHFQTTTLKGFGIEALPKGMIAAGTILHYLSETQHHKLGHITNISRIATDKYVWLDRFTIRNLELYFSANVNAVTLLDIIDKTISPMGGRLLKRWLALPLKDKKAIEARLDIVDFLIKNKSDFEGIEHQIKQIGDIERLVSKVATQKIHPREIIQLKNSLKAILPIKEQASASANVALQQIGSSLHPLKDLIAKVETVLKEDAPVNITKGNAINDGFSNELDELRKIAFSGKDYLDQIVTRERENTGIPSLKIAFNNVFGYYLEVRNTHKDKVPEEWVRKQTLVSAERYITEELKEYETKILGAEDKIQQIESKLYLDLVLWLADFIQPIQHNAALVAKLDCLLSFVQLAKVNKYIKPEITEDTSLDIKNGRHPVIEKQLPLGEAYIANDVFLDREKQQIIMITGPNMSGKSAILRQTALIVLLAQMGSFVPADSAKIGLVDKIFTRVGASDNISMGESTFMVEMNETASILNNLSERSLVLLDEIGRGTSTYDGVSIAWAIAEYLHEHPSRAKTLFATHYHELNKMTDAFERVKNYNVSVKELKDKVIFLRKLVEGGSHHSFGIHVAKMAGMPNLVISKANKILKELEKRNNHKQTEAVLKQVQKEDMQLSFFQLDDPLLLEIKEELEQVDINTLTPVEALMKLNALKRMLTKKNKK
jgi:DNA mismatch repair protein MutS